MSDAVSAENPLPEVCCVQCGAVVIPAGFKFENVRINPPPVERTVTLQELAPGAIELWAVVSAPAGGVVYGPTDGIFKVMYAEEPTVPDRPDDSTPPVLIVPDDSMLGVLKSASPPEALVYWWMDRRRAKKKAKAAGASSSSETEVGE